jgi:hypothetical protein
MVTKPRSALLVTINSLHWLELTLTKRWKGEKRKEKRDFQFLRSPFSFLLSISLT